MCNCGRSNQPRSIGRPVSAPRTATRTPNIPTPTEQRSLALDAARRKAAVNSPNGMGTDRAEQERLRRLAVLRALGHS